MMQGASFTERTISRIPIGSSLPPILLLAMIMVVVIVSIEVVIVVVFVGIVVRTVKVVVVVVGGVKLSFVIVGFFSCSWSPACLGVLVGIVSICHVNSLCFQSSSNVN